MWPRKASEVAAACGAAELEGGVGERVVSGATSDSRKVGPGELFVAVVGEKIDGHTFVADALRKGAELALVATSWTGFEALPAELRTRCLRVKDVLASFRKLAALLRTTFPFPVIGIGGSNGKTTTKEMLAAVLSGGGRVVTKTAKSENGFLGLALTLCAREHNRNKPPHMLVLEIGIDAKGAMEEHVAVGKPNVVLLTALGPEHLAGLDNWETAVREEYKLFELSEKSVARIWQCADEKLMERLADVRAGDVLVVEKNQIASVEAKINTRAAWQGKGLSALEYAIRSQTPSASTVSLSWGDANGLCEKLELEVPLPGLHNVQNFALAVATAFKMGLSKEDIKEGWRSFVPPEMRSRIVTLKNGTILYDDCYNASPASVKAALDVLCEPSWQNKKKVTILGDMLDLGQESKKWHLELVRDITRLSNCHLCLYGDAMYDVYKAITDETNFVTREGNAVSYLGKNEEPTKFLESFPKEISNGVVLVKASRGMDLGRVVKAVTERFDR